MHWNTSIEKIRPYVVQISTPQTMGTGWMISRSSTTSVVAVATAAHVIEHAHSWEEPIRITHHESGESMLVRAGDRGISVDVESDTAWIAFERGDIPFPETAPDLIAEDNFYLPGVEIGWLGYPAIERAGLCFFAGHVSAYILENTSYLVDGVAINGVSGGPAFFADDDDNVQLLGVVSAYIPNRATGEVLPGVAVVRNVSKLYEATRTIQSLDDAKSEETPPAEVPLPATSAEVAGDAPAKPGRTE
jgi:hypothetical protein